MATPDSTYQYFLDAFRHQAEKKYYRQKNNLAAELNISSGHISLVLNGTKRASFKLQTHIANLFGYEYIDFIAFGRSLTEPKDVSEPEQKYITDEERLRKTIQIVEKTLTEKKLVLSPRRKTALIMYLFKKRQTGPEQIDELIPLLSDET